jgi:signal transduction histidine kinase
VPVAYKGLLVVALPVVALVATFLLRLPFSEQQQSTTALLARSADTRDRAQQVLIALLDLETGARGFALTGDDNYLKPYKEALARLPQAVAALRAVVAEGNEYRLFENLAMHVERRLRIAEEVVALGQRGVPSGDPVLNRRLIEGKREMTSARAELDTLLATQQQLVEQSEDELRRIRQRLIPIVWITFLGGFTGAGTAMYLFATGIARRVAALRRNAERLAQGERLRHEVSRGHDEIGQLDRAMRRAAITIRERDHALRALNSTLEQSLHEQQILNRELEAFSYSVSHDLRAPLRSIDGFAQALREDWGDRLDEAGQDHLSRVRNAAQRMGRLIDDLLKLSRLSRTQIQRIDVNLSQLARSIASELHERNPTRDVAWRIDDNLQASCDPALARIMLENLLGNAWKFTSKTANACIEFTVVPERDPTTFVVRDNGAGFDMKYADKLFAPFQRLHGEREFPGTGIGLATVQRIVHKHGGSVRTRAEIGRGASFFFTLEPSDGVAAA